MYEGKEYLMRDAEVVKTSLGGNVANVNNSTSQTFITFRRGLCQGGFFFFGHLRNCCR